MSHLNDFFFISNIPQGEYISRHTMLQRDIEYLKTSIAEGHPDRNEYAKKLTIYIKLISHMPVNWEIVSRLKIHFHCNLEAASIKDIMAVDGYTEKLVTETMFKFIAKGYVSVELVNDVLLFKPIGQAMLDWN